MADVEFPNYLATFQAGAQAGQQMRLQQARQNALATYQTDPQGAQNALIAAGDIDTANALGQIADRQQQRTTRASVSQKLSTGDYRGAQGDAIAGGNPQLASAVAKLQDDDLAIKDRQANILGGSIDALLQIPDLNERRAVLQAHAADLSQALGVKPEDVANYDVSDQNLRYQLGHAVGLAKAIDYEKQRREANKPLVVGSALVDPNTHQPLYQAPVTLKPGEELVDPSQPPAPQGQPASQPQTADANAPRGLRNNNPLNLRPLPQGQWNGQTGTDSAGYATFASPQDGWNAAHQNLISYATHHGINTVQGVIGRWAPAGADGNDPAAYAATVSKALGVDPTAPINLQDAGTREKLLSAMANVELGQPYGGPQAAAQPQPPQGRGRVLASVPAAPPKANWQVLTDPKTNTQYRYDPNSGEAQTLDGKPYTPQGAQKIGGGGQARSAAALAAQQYKQEHPNATAEDIAQFNASLNLTKSSVQAFGTGKQGQQINSLNVAIDHLGTMSELADALHNGNVPLINKFAQAIATATGSAAPTNFNSAKQIVGAEIIKAIANGGGGVTERQEAERQINAASSPDQLAGVIQTYKKLLAGQLNGLRTQYQKTTGRNDFEDRLLPETRQQLESLGVGAQPSAAAQGAAAPPPNRLKPGVQTTFANGQTWTLGRDGKPQRVK